MELKIIMIFIKKNDMSRDMLYNFILKKLI